MIKKFENFDIDPYGEENWEDEERFEEGDYLIAKKSQFKRRKEGMVERIVQGETYKVQDVIHMGDERLYRIIVPGILLSVAVFNSKKMKEFFERK